VVIPADVNGDATASTVPSFAPSTVSTTSTPALAWVDEDAFAAGRASSTNWLSNEDLLGARPRRSVVRLGTVVPLAVVVLLIVAYIGGAALWPLDALRPKISPVAVESRAAAAATPAWPSQGSGAVAVDGFGAPLASTQNASTIASITKVVTVLMVLDRLPLKPGEQGPSYKMTAADTATYRTMLNAGESVLKVPVGGSLTEYQLLQGTLIGSAGNYITKLARSIWANDSDFAGAARVWLDQHGLNGISLVGPTGISKLNQANPASLVPLGQLAMANPVVAEIVATKSVVLPGAGPVTNTNELLAEPGIVGIKTGTLDTYDLLAAKDVTVGATKVRLYAATLGQADGKGRVSTTDALFNELQKELALFPSVPKGTKVGTVTTKWGETVPLVTTSDAAVVLWNGAKGTVQTDVALEGATTKGDKVGTLSVTGPLDKASSEVVLTADLDGPSLWWRLTNPLALLGAN
jgi:D-alanyl-D-alanine carboxypeptidase (penicillin-binding protein 5/6)